jgi:hypothetical protein
MLDARRELSLASDIAHVEGFRLTATALEAPEGLTVERWESALAGVMRIEQGSRWWLGDLLVFGGRRYGQTYARAMKETGYSYGHLRNLAHAARRVPPKNRREDLSWGAHAVVAPHDLARQRYYLALAAEEGLNARELALRIADEDRLAATGDGVGDAPLPVKRRGLNARDHLWAALIDAGVPVSGGRLNTLTWDMLDRLDLGKVQEVVELDKARQSR